MTKAVSEMSYREINEELNGRNWLTTRGVYLDGSEGRQREIELRNRIRQLDRCRRG